MTAVRRVGCAANSTSCRRAICEWRWRRWLLTAHRVACGRPSCNTGSAAAVPCRGTRSAICCWPASTRYSPTRLLPSTKSAGYWACGAGCCRCARSRCKSRPMSPAWKPIRGCSGRSAGRWRSPPHRERSAGCDCCPEIRRPPGRPSTRSCPPIWWCWVRARGSPACSRTCWCPSLPRRCRRPRPVVRWCSIWWPNRGRRQGSRSNAICTYLPSTLRVSPFTT